MIKQTDPKPEMTICPICKVPLRNDNLDRHLERLHKIQQQLPNEPVGSIQHICPMCKKDFSSSQWLAHYKTCKKQYKQEHKEKQKDQGSVGKQVGLRPIYVSDEFGVVQTYDKWFENETMGDRVEVKPSITSGFKKPFSKKDRSSTKKSTTRNQSDSSYLKDLVPCSKCGVRIQLHCLEKHMETAHNQSLGQKIKKDTTPKPIKTVESLKIPFNNLDAETQQKIHGKLRKDGGERVKQLARMKTSIGILGMQTCPFCKEELPVADLPDHIQSRHPQKKKQNSRAKTKIGSMSKRKNQNKPVTLPEGKADLLDMNETRDGSKFLGHFKRESGQFGSYPLHDDYGDESDAG